MGATAEKLTYLNTTKQNLKTVINTTGAGLTDESTFRSYANVLNDKILGAINGDVDLFEEYPKVSGNGADLSLNGVVEDKMSITPQGVSSQDGEPTPTTPISVKSVTGENNLVLQNENLFDGELEFGMLSQTTGNPQGTATDRKRTKNYVNVENINEVTLNFSVITTTSAYGRFFLYDKDYNMLSNTQIAGSTKTINVENAYYVKWWTSDTVDYDTFMLVKGSTAPSTYVEHEEQNYRLSLGNIELNSSPDGTIRDGIIGSSDVSYNLFNKNDVIKGNYQINSSHSLVSSNSNRVLFIPCKPNTTYTVSKKISNYYTIGFINEEPSVNISVTGYMRNPSLEYLTSTSDSDSKYLACWYYNTGETLTEQEILDSIQITEGSEVKPYFPYGQVGMWYKREYIGKIVLDGSESGWINEGGGAPYTLNIPNSLITTSNNELPNVLVDKFKRVTYNSNWNNYNSLVAPGTATVASQTKLKFRYTDISGLNSWKQWLSENNVTVYYLKAQYTDIPITDTALISQLNNIYNNAHSYNGVTNTTTTYEDGNEQMYLDIEALKNVWEVTE